MGIRKTKAVALLAALPLAGAMLVGVAAPAHAAEGVNMHLVCQWTAGKSSYAARVINQTASGWQCYDRAPWPFTGPNRSANIWGYCRNVLGYSGAYNTSGSVYGWYCA